MPDPATSGRIPVVLGIDVEPDRFFVRRENPEPWDGLTATHRYLRELRSELEEVTGQAVPFTWFLRMDPQVAAAYGNAKWAVERHAALFDEVRGHGDALGVHVHTYRWSDRAGNWIDDCGNHDWVTECLESSVRAYREAFGEAPGLLRFGNFWCSTDAVNRAEELSVRFDLTVEPGLPPNTFTPTKPRVTGALPDYYRVPRVPYAPDRADFRRRSRKGDRRILMIPLTSGSLRLGRDPRGWSGRVQRLARNGFRGRSRSFPLSLWRSWGGANPFSDMLTRAIAAQRNPYLAFAVHSNFPVTKEAGRVDASVRALVTHPESSRFVFCTPPGAVEMLGLGSPP